MIASDLWPGALGGTRTPSLLIRSRCWASQASRPALMSMISRHSGSRIAGFPGFPLAGPLAALEAHTDVPEPASRFTVVNVVAGPITYSDIPRLAPHAISAWPTNWSSRWPRAAPS
jgi:hypothetical protein